jgi:hypothetical protein
MIDTLVMAVDTLLGSGKINCLNRASKVPNAVPKLSSVLFSSAEHPVSTQTNNNHFFMS